MDKIQKVLIKAGRKDLAQLYYIRLQNNKLKSKIVLATSEQDFEHLERKIFDGKTVNEIRKEKSPYSVNWSDWYNKLKSRGVIGKDYGIVTDKVNNLGFRFTFKMGKFVMVY